MVAKRKRKKAAKPKAHKEPQADARPDTSIVVETSDSGETNARLKQIRERFRIMQTFWTEIHTVGLEDDKFIAGEQWAEQVRKDRQEARRPMLTYNVLPAFTRQITNKARESRPQVRVQPVESNRGRSPKIVNLTGTQDYSLADIYMGIIRNIEHRSRATHAYDTALKHAVDHGFGYFMLRNEWSKGNPFVQDLTIKRVKNAYSIYMDPDSKESDFSDMQDAFMFTNVRRETFEEKYPGIQSIDFAHGNIASAYEGWYDTEQVRIAQYWWIDWREDHVLMLSNGKAVYENDVADVLDDMQLKEGIHVLIEGGEEMRKKVRRPICMWQKMTAMDVLEGPLDLPFNVVPIFPVLGEEIMVDGRTRYESAIRHAKDAQRSYNYWRTAATETVALAPRAPWMLTERQVQGYEDMYERANVENQPYLLYNHVEGVPEPRRQVNAQTAAAELQNATQDSQDMQTIIGLHDASLGRESNEKSGKAIIARQTQGSTSTYQFPDNLTRAQESMGRLMVYAIPRMYDTQRVLRIRMPDDTDDFVEINQTVLDDKTGEAILVHDIGYGEYDVAIETGKDYNTQRQEAAELQMELLKVLSPEKADSIAHLIVKNMGVPGSDEVASILRRMLPEGLKSEDDKAAELPPGIEFDPEGQPVNIETGEPWQKPLTPQEQLMQAQQELETAKIEVGKAEAAADQKLAEAKMAEAEAKIAAARAKMAELQAPPAQAPEGPDMGQFMQDIQRIIQETMADHEDNVSAHKGPITDQITDAVVEALQRVKRYVDKNSAAAMAPPQVVGPPAKTNGATPPKPGQQLELPQILIELPAGDKTVEFTRDEGGRIAGAVIKTGDQE